jgi:hypothetical protein
VPVWVRGQVQVSPVPLRERWQVPLLRHGDEEHGLIVVELLSSHRSPGEGASMQMGTGKHGTIVQEHKGMHA